MDKAFKSDQDAYEVMIYAETGQWPSVVEEETRNKAFVQKSPENRELFTKSELDELLPLAKQAFKESEG